VTPAAPAPPKRRFGIAPLAAALAALVIVIAGGAWWALNANRTASLGATPGTYKWTWGSGANQNFTLVIGTVIREPATWAMMLLGFAGLGFMGYRSAGRRTAPHV
jgi:hypothetical protein